MTNQSMPPKLQDCPIPDPSQASSASTLTVPPNQSTPPTSAALPALSLLIDFLKFGQTRNLPIHFARHSTFWSHPHTTSLHTDPQPTDNTIASSRILWKSQRTEPNDRLHPYISHFHNMSWNIWLPVTYLPPTRTNNLHQASVRFCNSNELPLTMTYSYRNYGRFIFKKRMTEQIVRQQGTLKKHLTKSRSTNH